MFGVKKKRIVNTLLRKASAMKDGGKQSDLYQPSVYHALVVIFLEFFAWGLLTLPIIKGILSFLSAPLVGALSDVWGRKPFLLITVTFTCAPIPLMKFSPWWYFAVISISGIFSVTFSIVFAYVADVTCEEDRSAAYGLVSATFAASLVTSPAIGAYLGGLYDNDAIVIALASAVAILDILFILVAVPESLSERLRPAPWNSQISWEKADPFGALKKIGQDELILMLCVTVFLSYLPEAGEYSCFFVYLKLVMGFTAESVASFIAVIGVLSVFAQTAILAVLMKYVGAKHAIMVGLAFEMLQLVLYGFGSQPWIMWVAGGIAAMGSITFPAVSAFVSTHSSADTQGVAQGMITGIRGLCNGLGPALYGFIFYLFHVNLNEKTEPPRVPQALPVNATRPPVRMPSIQELMVPGPPFAFGALLVFLALAVAFFIPEQPLKSPTRRSAPLSLEKMDRASAVHKERKQVGVTQEIQPLMAEDLETPA